MAGQKLGTIEGPRLEVATIKNTILEGMSNVGLPIEDPGVEFLLNMLHHSRMMS